MLPASSVTTRPRQRRLEARQVLRWTEPGSDIDGWEDLYWLAFTLNDHADIIYPVFLDAELVDVPVFELPTARASFFGPAIGGVPDEPSRCGESRLADVLETEGRDLFEGVPMVLQATLGQEGVFTWCDS